MSFAFKRGHLSAVRFGRKAFLKAFLEAQDPRFLHMTPARFDMLAVLFGPTSSVYARGRTYALPQHELQQALGLAHATVSETVKRLVELGLVRRYRCDRDRRFRIVQLERLGFDAIRAALNLVYGDRVVAKPYEDFASTAFRPRRVHDRDVALQRQIDLTFDAAAAVGNTTPSIHPLRVRKEPDRPKHSAWRRPRPKDHFPHLPFEVATWHVEAPPGPRSRRVDFEDYLPSHRFLPRDLRGRFCPEDDASDREVD